MNKVIVFDSLTPINAELQETIQTVTASHWNYGSAMASLISQNYCSLCGRASECTCNKDAEAYAERVYKKVTGIIGTADAKSFVYKAAFHQAAVEEGVEPKTELMATIERICMHQAFLEGAFLENQNAD